MPLSAAVGMSGASALRLGVVIASALTWPPRACGSSTSSGSIISCTWPPATSVSAGAVPR